MEGIVCKDNQLSTKSNAELEDNYLEYTSVNHMWGGGTFSSTSHVKAIFDNNCLHGWFVMQSKHGLLDELEEQIRNKQAATITAKEQKRVEFEGMRKFPSIDI